MEGWSGWTRLKSKVYAPATSNEAGITKNYKSREEMIHKHTESSPSAEKGWSQSAGNLCEQQYVWVQAQFEQKQSKFRCKQWLFECKGRVWVKSNTQPEYEFNKSCSQTERPRSWIKIHNLSISYVQKVTLIIMKWQDNPNDTTRWSMLSTCRWAYHIAHCARQQHLSLLLYTIQSPPKQWVLSLRQYETTPPLRKNPKQ